VTKTFQQKWPKCFSEKKQVTVHTSKYKQPHTCYSTHKQIQLHTCYSTHKQIQVTTHMLQYTQTNTSNYTHANATWQKIGRCQSWRGLLANFQAAHESADCTQVAVLWWDLCWGSAGSFPRLRPEGEKEVWFDRSATDKY